MFLYKEGLATNKRDRDSVTITLDNEKLDRPVADISKGKDKVRFIQNIEKLIRSSMEYKDYINFLKQNMDMNRCEVLRGLKITNGKKYRIELHHDPFTLFDLVETVVNKFDALDMELNPFKIADEIMELHYDGYVGLVPVSKTMHDLVHVGKIFIPLQFIYHNYAKFYKDYEPYMNPILIEKVQTKANLSLKTNEVMSDVLKPIFTYIEVEGVSMPEVPDEWKDIFKSS